MCCQATGEIRFSHSSVFWLAAMGQRQTIVSELCQQLGVTRQTLYRPLGSGGSLREDGQKVLAR